ncbi:MAG: universal stress protein [Azonexus sp.]|nr:universal stress protein [Azonexus sp.]
MTQLTLQPPGSIVVATDFSPPANLALEQAARLAKSWGSDLHLLCACDPDDANAMLLQRGRLEKQQEYLAESHGVHANVFLRTGHASVQIIQLVNEIGAGLVVVGEHSQSWLKDRFLGGTALKVLRQASVPVLLVRSPLSNEFRKVMAATDFSGNALRAMRLAATFFPHATLLIQHACSLQKLHRMRLDGEKPEKMEAYRQQQIEAANAGMARFREELGLATEFGAQWHVTAESDNQISILLNVLRQENPDLLVVGRHGGSEIDERLFGSTTENLLYHANTNILLVP